MDVSPGILVRGTWLPEQVQISWSDELYDPPTEVTEEADEAIAQLARRGSPSHDGLSTRLAAFRASAGELHLDLQPIRWSLRLTSDACQSLAAMCAVRSADGRWLAGHRAEWLASWPGRWALGAGGSPDPGEHPVDTLRRELHEEWSVAPEHLSVEALLCLEQRLVLFLGLAWLPANATVSPDDEHSGYAWWPPDPESWPPEADGAVREMGLMLAS
jgi:ADP-ribose pyrophosphatase YjhB (NUDIX family)